MMEVVKAWQETARVYGELIRRLSAGQSAAVATLIRQEGSSYRRPGAKLLIGCDGALVGQVSGGCLEEDLRERGLRALRTGSPERIHYDTGADENVVWGLGLGCNGKIDLWLQPYMPGPARPELDAVRDRLAGDQPFHLRLSLTDGALALGGAGPGDQTKLTDQVFDEVLSPPADLLVVGAGEDARPLVRLAAEVGFRVSVVDHRRAFLEDERFPGAHQRILARPEQAERCVSVHARTIVVLMTHAAGLDQAWARYFAGTPAAYIGLLGPAARRAEILAAVPEPARSRFYGPVGLDIAAEGSEQIAVSIVAEALAALAGRPGGHLRERAKPIHG